MPYVHVVIPAWAQNGKVIDATVNKSVMRAMLLNEHWLRLQTEEGPQDCRILSAVAQDGLMSLWIFRPRQDHDDDDDDDDDAAAE